MNLDCIHLTRISWWLHLQEENVFYRERLAMEYERTGELLVDLGSDQTSLHNPFGGGYCPVQLQFDEMQEVMKMDPMRFKELVQER